MEEQVGQRRRSVRQGSGLTWEVPAKLHLPVCGRVEAVVVTRSQVDHDVKQVVVRAGQQEVPEGRWRG